MGEEETTLEIAGLVRPRALPCIGATYGAELDRAGLRASLRRFIPNSRSPAGYVQHGEAVCVGSQWKLFETLFASRKRPTRGSDLCRIPMEAATSREEM